jgi:hypothetical protein
VWYVEAMGLLFTKAVSMVLACMGWCGLFWKQCACYLKSNEHGACLHGLVWGYGSNAHAVHKAVSVVLA